MARQFATLCNRSDRQIIKITSHLSGMATLLKYRGRAAPMLPSVSSIACAVSGRQSVPAIETQKDTSGKFLSSLLNLKQHPGVCPFQSHSCPATAGDGNGKTLEKRSG